MNVDLETRLTSVFEERLGALDPGAPATDTLVRRGRQRRNRRRVAAAALVAAGTAATVVVGTTIGDAPGRQRIQDGLPVASNGAAGPAAMDGPTGLFVTRDSVYLNGERHAVKTVWDTGAHVSARGLAFPDPETGRPTLLDLDGQVVPLGSAIPAGGASYRDWVAADSGSGMVAWSEEDRASLRSEMVVYDVDQEREVARRSFDCTRTAFDTKTGKSRELAAGESPGPREDAFTECPMPYVVADGVVFYDADGRSSAWDVTTDRTVPTGSSVSQAHAGVVGGFEASEVDVSRLGGDWEFAEPVDGYEGILSYDGGWFLDNSGKPTIVNWRDPSQTVRYDPPGSVQAATFDTDGSVLVVTEEDGEWSGWDCPVDARCEQVVPAQQDEIRLVAWDL